MPDVQAFINAMQEQRDTALSNCATLELRLRFVEEDLKAANERVAELEASLKGQPAPAPLHIVEPKPAA